MRFEFSFSDLSDVLGDSVANVVAEFTTGMWDTCSTTAIFDIETRPLPDDVLARIVPPFDRDSVEPPGEFDESKVKYGRTKDPEKRAMILADARARHEAEVATFAAAVDSQEHEYWEKVVAGATLEACRSQVCCIGVLFPGAGCPYILAGDEESQLLAFWELYRRCLRIVGFNIYAFDLPYLVRRSWIVGVPVPADVRSNGRWNDVFLDLARIWNLGVGPPFISLDQIARAMGVGEKSGQEVNGKYFHKFWDDPDCRERAVRYLVNDLRLTMDIAERMGV